MAFPSNKKKRFNYAASGFWEDFKIGTFKIGGSNSVTRIQQGRFLIVPCLRFINRSYSLNELILKFNSASFGVSCEQDLLSKTVDCIRDFVLLGGFSLFILKPFYDDYYRITKNINYFFYVLIP